jgi:hypothetical protein
VAGMLTHGRVASQPAGRFSDRVTDAYFNVVSDLGHIIKSINVYR